MVFAKNEAEEQEFQLQLAKENLLFFVRNYAKKAINWKNDRIIRICPTNGQALRIFDGPNDRLFIRKNEVTAKQKMRLLLQFDFIKIAQLWVNARNGSLALIFNLYGVLVAIIALTHESITMTFVVSLLVLIFVDYITTPMATFDVSEIGLALLSAYKKPETLWEQAPNWQTVKKLAPETPQVTESRKEIHFSTKRGSIIASPEIIALWMINILSNREMWVPDSGNPISDLSNLLTDPNWQL
jgi:hypothetical protein